MDRSGTLNAGGGQLHIAGTRNAARSSRGGVRLLEPERSRRCSRTGEKEMSVEQLEATARALVSPGKGILAADESHPSIARRFEPLGIPNSEDTRRRYRQMLLTTPGAADYVSGVILFDETIRQKADDGTPLVEVLSRQGIIPGIKVDRGAKALAGAPGRAGDGRPRRAARAARRVLGPGRPLRQVARGDHHRPGRSRRIGRSWRTPTRWRATPPCARRRGWCRSSSPRCSWTGTTPSSAASR